MTELLVDGNGLVCRLWYASAHEVRDRFCRAIYDVAGSKEDWAVAVAWDTAPSWRSTVDPGYKAHRGPKPLALKAALSECRGIFRDLYAPGLEADDVLAIECRLAVAGGHNVVVMSDDKDMAQLVGPRVLWLARGKVHNDTAVISKFGVPPDRIRHLLSWIGDKVDNLPGVKGYGPKRAIPKALAGEIGNETTYRLTALGGPDDGR